MWGAHRSLRAVLGGRGYDPRVSYAFRIRFRLSGFVRLNTGPEHELTIGTQSGEDVILRALETDQALEDAEQLVLLGKGYATG